MSKGHRGAHSELLASAELINEGYEVFRNVCPDGPADLIAWRPETGEVRILDIKTATKTTRPQGFKAGALTTRQVGLGVQRIAVLPGGEMIVDSRVPDEDAEAQT